MTNVESLEVALCKVGRRALSQCTRYSAWDSLKFPRRRATGPPRPRIHYPRDPLTSRRYFIRSRDKAPRSFASNARIAWVAFFSSDRVPLWRSPSKSQRIGIPLEGLVLRVASVLRGRGEKEAGSVFPRRYSTRGACI